MFKSVMRIYVLLISFLFSYQLTAQKVIEKTIDAANISSIVIEGNNMFKINVSTLKTNFAIIKTKIEGEYSDQMVVLVEVMGDTLNVSSKFQPLFKKDDDKLGAHKVMSVEVELVVPRNLNIYIVSENASSNIKGVYKNLFVELAQGNCIVDSFLGNAIINTINGKIEMNSNFAAVEAVSKAGSVFHEPLLLGENQIKLNSINGDISVTKTK